MRAEREEEGSRGAREKRILFLLLLLVLSVFFTGSISSLFRGEDDEHHHHHTTITTTIIGRGDIRYKIVTLDRTIDREIPNADDRVSFPLKATCWSPVGHDRFAG